MCPSFSYLASQTERKFVRVRIFIPWRGKALKKRSMSSLEASFSPILKGDHQRKSVASLSQLNQDDKTLVFGEFSRKKPLRLIENSGGRKKLCRWISLKAIWLSSKKPQKTLLKHSLDFICWYITDNKIFLHMLKFLWHSFYNCTMRKEKNLLKMNTFFLHIHNFLIFLFGGSEEVTDDVHRHGEDDRRVLLRADRVQRLEVAQLQRRRRLADDLGGLA